MTRDLDQVHLALGFQGTAFNDPNFHAMQVLSTLYGGGMSSRLFQKFERNGGWFIQSTRLLRPIWMTDCSVSMRAQAR